MAMPMGRKPSMPAKKMTGVMGSPPAGAPANATLSAGKPSPSPTTDLAPQPAVPTTYGTHIGSTAQPQSAWIPKRRNIATNAK